MNTFKNTKLFEYNRSSVKSSYDAACSENGKRFIMNDVKSSEEYTYENQKIDSHTITNIFYRTMQFERPVRAISIIKRTKVGCDGLMIEISKNMATHPDDNFMLLSENIFIITGMSNKEWEFEFKKKVPSSFHKNIYHHGKLNNVINKIKNIENALIIIDEIDTGDKEFQRLHKILLKCGLLNIDKLNKNNIRLIFVSATIKNQLKELNKWGDVHVQFTMTVPKNYISHGDFLEKKIIKEFYPIKNVESANMWILEDIINNYNDDYRINIIRTDKNNIRYIEQACDDNKIQFINHYSDNKISIENMYNMFESKLDNHVVIAIKGFYRRANLIPNIWKLKIGALHERFCNKIDTSVQIQGLPGRMTGYWKNIIFDESYKTGPYRTSIKAIQQYEKFYNDPNNNHKYNTNGSKKTFLDPKNFNIEYKEQKNIKDKEYKIFDKQDDAIKFVYQTFNIRLKKRKHKNAAKILLDHNGSNPSVEYILNRYWGIDKKTPIRMIPTNNNSWCLYWRPSLM